MTASEMCPKLFFAKASIICCVVTSGRATDHTSNATFVRFANSGRWTMQERSNNSAIIPVVPVVLEAQVSKGASVLLDNVTCMCSYSRRCNSAHRRRG